MMQVGLGLPATPFESSSLAQHVRFSHVARPEFCVWLNVRPDENLGTVQLDSEFRVACGLRLGLGLIAAHPCSCGTSIAAASQKRARHNAVDNVLVRAFRHAGFAVRAELAHLCEDENVRLDSMTLTPWAWGKLLIWDVSIRNLFAASYVAISRTVCSIAANAENIKRAHYAASAGSHIVVPFIVESSGVRGLDALDTSKALGKMLERATGDKRSLDFLRQRIALEFRAATLG